MLLCYIDESYDKKTFLIACVVVPETQVQPLSDTLHAVGMDWAHVTLDSEAEFHGADIMNGRGPWTRLTGIDRRLDLYSELLQSIARHEVAIITEGLDRQALVRRYPSWPAHTIGYAHRVVATYIFERINEYALRHDQRALVIADEVVNGASFRRDLAWYRTWSTWGYKAQKLTNIVDTVHFSPSHASRLLQAADLVAHLQYRVWLRSSDPRARSAAERLWGLLHKRVYSTRRWEP